MPVSDRPEPILHGGLVYLRPAERSDIPHFVRWLSDVRTTGYIGARSPIGLAMEERWFDDLLDHHGRDRWFFVICRLEDDRPVGSLDLRELGLTNGGAGLGIVIGDPADTSQGYGSDALRVLIDFGFGELRLERIWLEVFEFNEASPPRVRAARVRPRGDVPARGVPRRSLPRPPANGDPPRGMGGAARDRVACLARLA